MSQDKIFADSEGNAWFRRNKQALIDADRFDWPVEMLRELAHSQKFDSICELGCSNGWRLDKLRNIFPSARLAGVDASVEAIEDGKQRYAGLELSTGILADTRLSGPFQVVVVNFVLHWVGRDMLLRSVAEIDRLLADGGYLVLSDFDPDCAQKRHYHHYLEQRLHTFKQDYARIFEAANTYRTIQCASFDHDTNSTSPAPAASNARGKCSLLQKSLESFYTEIA